MTEPITTAPSAEGQNDAEKPQDGLKVEQPKPLLGEAEQQLANRISKGKNPDQVLQDLAGEAGTLRELLHTQGSSEKLTKWPGKDELSRWRLDPKQEAAPIINATNTGVRRASFVDLHILPPGSLVSWEGEHHGAGYTLKKIDDRTVEVWQTGSGKGAGLIGNLEDIATKDHVTYNQATDEIMVYKGVLIRNRTAGVQTGISMPYFTYDKDHRVELPRTHWMDTIQSLNVLEPQAAALTPQQALERNRMFLNVAQAQKSGRQIEWDESNIDGFRMIQRRLQKGETLDEIIAKLAANLRSLTQRYGSKP